MTYDRHTYWRDLRAAWEREKSKVSKGLASPIRVALKKKSSVPKEYRNWLTLFLICIPRFIGKAAFYTIRLLVNK